MTCTGFDLWLHVSRTRHEAASHFGSWLQHIEVVNRKRSWKPNGSCSLVIELSWGKAERSLKGYCILSWPKNGSGRRLLPTLANDNQPAGIISDIKQESIVMIVAKHLQHQIQLPWQTTETYDGDYSPHTVTLLSRFAKSRHNPSRSWKVFYGMLTRAMAFGSGFEASG
jgi:hypothetical protein